jgi:hypothetical protein
MEFVTRVFDKTGATPPGTDSRRGRGYFRIALTSSADSLRRALQKLETLAPWKAPHASPSPIAR